MLVVDSILEGLLRLMGRALDGLDVALCAFDDQNRVLTWNDTFLELFPEHAGKVAVGEHYAENLRRFYLGRLAQEELPQLERYVHEGVERHRTQRRPYEFDHRGYRLRVSLVDLGDLGRVRLWRKVRARAVLAPGVDPIPGGRMPPSAAVPLLERIGDGILVVDASDRAVWANRAFMRLYELPGVADMAGKTFDDIYRHCWQGQGDDPDFVSSIETLRENRRFSGAPYELSLPGARWVRVVEDRDPGADAQGYLVHVDITALKRQQQALQAAQRQARESEARYRLLAEFSSDVTVALSDGVIHYVSPAVFELLGWRPQDVIGKSLEDFCHPDDVAHVSGLLDKLNGSPRTDYRVRALRVDGSHVWVEARARLSRPPDDESPLLVINVRNVAARKATEDRLAQALASLKDLAVTDSLTGVANRRRFDEALKTEWQRAHRDHSPLALLFVDLDRFKLLNDSYGHLVGDAVLRAVAGTLAGLAQRAGDVVARYGGEEFAMLLPNTSSDNALALATHACLAVSALDATRLGLSPGASVTISIGVANSVFMPAATSEQQLVHCADEALFAAKRAGRNRVVVAAQPCSPQPDSFERA